MNSEEIKNFFAYDFRKFLKIDFLKYIFFSLDGRIDRKTWWYSKLYLYIVAFLFMIPIGALFSALSFDQNDLAKVIVFFSLILSILIFYVLFQYLVTENIIKFFSSYQQNYILYFVPTLPIGKPFLLRVPSNGT